MPEPLRLVPVVTGQVQSGKAAKSAAKYAASTKRGTKRVPRRSRRRVETESENDSESVGGGRKASMVGEMKEGSARDVYDHDD